MLAVENHRIIDTVEPAGKLLSSEVLVEACWKSSTAAACNGKTKQAAVAETIDIDVEVHDGYSEKITLKPPVIGGGTKAADSSLGGGRHTKSEVVKQSELRRRFATREEYISFMKSYDYKDPHVPKHQNGPDYVIPSDSYVTTEAEGTVKLRVGTTGKAAMPVVSLVTLLKDQTATNPDIPALSCSRDGVTRTWTYSEYLKDVILVAKGFMKLGLLPLHAVSIAGFNCPEWFIADLGAIFAGGIATGMYQTNSPEENYHILSDSRANVVVVEDEKQLDKILKIRDRLPHLRAIVQYNGDPQQPDVLSWKNLKEIGETVPDEALERRIKGIAVNQCCTLIYTSGTTGPSKGVMISHDSMAFEARLVAETLGLNMERMISYLPLSHVAAQSTELFGVIASASCIYFARPDALKGSLKDTLLEVRPTRWFGVPRVFEKMYDAMKAKERDMNVMSKSLFRLARKVGRKYAVANNKGLTTVPTGYGLASVILKKVSEAMGLDQCKTIMCAGAPISSEVLEYFHSIGIMIREGFGMSETVLHTFNMPGATRIGSIGRTFSSLETRIYEPDSSGQGELCMRGRHVCMGYLNMEDKTRETLDSEGWLHSGDLVRSDPEQYLYITGRIKELLITAGGENVAPVPIEDRIKKELPFISFAMVVGDRKKFLSALLTIGVETDRQTGAPTSDLSPAALRWVRQLDLSCTTVTELLAHPELLVSSIQEGIDRANEDAVSNASRVQKWAIVPDEFSVSGGELGPTMKMRRPFICKKYVQQIDALYMEHPVTRK